jgi:hypothetical protein
MDAKTTADTLKRLALLKNDGATPEIREQAEREYTALKSQLRAELAKPKDWRK